MKNVTLTLIKKNRVYFKCLNESGYEVKLKIDAKSEALELGKQELLVNDVSIRTKYGTDIIYELEGEIKDTGIVTLKHRYNKILVEKCRELGGKWDKDNEVWVFSKIVEDKIEELENLYCKDMIWIEISILEDTYGFQGPFCFRGYPLAKATGRDSGAFVCEYTYMIGGNIDSGGSMKNWSTEVKAGSKFRIEISKNLLESKAWNKEVFDIKVL